MIQVLRKIAFLFPLIFIAFSTGCATNEIVQETTQSTSFRPSSNKSMITGSVSMYGGTYGSFELKQISTGKTQSISARNNKDGLAWRSRNGHGRTYMLELEPGHYEITDWHYSVLYGMGADKSIKPKNMKAIPVELKAGEMIYLGDFNFKTTMGKNIFNIGIPAGLVVKVRNKRERDLNNLKKKFPNLDTNSIKDNIINYSIGE